MAQDKYREAVKHLRKGELIVYPTDTTYGLGGDATSRRVVNRIRKLKHRPKEKYLTVMVSDHNMLKRWAKMDKLQERIARGLMPGKYTMILEPRRKLPVSPDTVGFRIPKHPCTRIAKLLNKPVISTSANIHGRPTPHGINDIKKLFGDDVAFYIAGGQLHKPPSRILDLVRMEVVRP
jgi:L-threonylcarbamoyladenylate synthase